MICEAHALTMLESFKFVLFLCLSILNQFPISSANLCVLKPRGSVGVPRDVGTRYRIAIVNNPEKYVPGVTYNGT